MFLLYIMCAIVTLSYLLTYLCAMKLSANMVTLRR